VKYFSLAVGPRPGDMSQNGPKNTSLVTSLRNKLQAPTKKFFFKCSLENWPICLSPWTAL